MDDAFPAEALLEDYPREMAALAEGLRLIVRSAVPESLERVRVGWRVIGYDLPIGRRTVYFAWVMPESAHVHLGFPKGILLDDPAGDLEGRGITKVARWFTLREPGDLADERLERFVRAAAGVARLSRPEQALLRHEREAAHATDVGERGAVAPGSARSKVGPVNRAAEPGRPRDGRLDVGRRDARQEGGPG